MLKSVKDQLGLRIFLVDGDCGSLTDVICDDRNWNLWLFIIKPYSRIPPYYAGIKPAEILKLTSAGIFIGLLLDEIEARTEIDKKLIAEKSMVYSLPFLGENGIMSIPLQEDLGRNTNTTPNPKQIDGSSSIGDISKKNIKNLLGMEVFCTDGQAGTIDDFLFDDQLWIIHFVVIALQGNDTRKVMVSTNWIKKIEDRKEKILLNLSLMQLQKQNQFLREKYFDKKYEDVINSLVLFKKEEPRI